MSINHESINTATKNFYTRMKAYRSAIDQKPPVSHPCNCKHPCAYGKDRAFCFPCYKKIMEEHKAARRKAALGA